MTRDAIMKLLAEHTPEIRERFGVTRLRLFGSVARDEAPESSDLDILVEFDGKPVLDNYFGLIFYLEDLLGREIDLVIESDLRPAFRPYVEADAIEIA